jgi:hypothetical protein
MGPTVGLSAVAKRKIPSLRRESNHRITIVTLNSPISLKLHNRLYYRKHNGIAQFYYKDVSKRCGEASRISI